MLQGHQPIEGRPVFGIQQAFGQPALEIGQRGVLTKRRYRVVGSVEDEGDTDRLSSDHQDAGHYHLVDRQVIALDLRVRA